VNSDKRTRTKWRRAMRGPLFIACREKFEAMVPGGNDLRHIDRLVNIDAANKTGTTMDKRRNITLNGGSRILPNFYGKHFCENEVRYPGDVVPNPQVQTDREYDEKDEDSGIEQQEDHSALKKKLIDPRQRKETCS
jgi:hypothetical protein